MNDHRNRAFAWYVAGLLSAAYTVAFVDRQILNLLVEPIKSDLGLSDTQFSLLQGVAFVTSYVAMGPVFGRLADRGNRRNLLIAAVVAWCACTVLCGFAHGFWSLFAARIGIGAAEACLLPASWSLLADYFSRDRLPRAMSIFLLGPFLGGGLALIFGGLLVTRLRAAAFGGILAGLPPWALTFICVGAPGLLIAGLLLTLREPERTAGLQSEDRAYSFAEVFEFLVKERAFYGRFMGGMALLVMTVYAFPAWTPAVLMRAYGAAPGSVGVQYGTAVLLTGSLGVLLGPAVARRLVRHFPLDAPLRTAVVAAAVAGPLCLFLPFAPTYWSALTTSAVASGFVNLALPVAASALQASTPNRMRGLVTSAYAFVLTSVGLAIAPTAIALVTDAILHQPKKVGISLGWLCAIGAVGSIPLLLGAARRYPARLASIADASAK